MSVASMNYANENSTSAINVQVNAKDKIEATKILKDCGISMSGFISMALKQVIRVKGVPFEITTVEQFNKETLEALKEAEELINEIKKGKAKGYDNMEDFVKSLNE